MKVNLLINGYGLNGYLNIDPLSQPGEINKVQHDIQNLDDIIDNNECTEFLAHNVIDSFPIQGRGNIMNHWMSKVEHNGIFVISGLDLTKVCRAIVSGDVDLMNGNNLLFGQCQNMWTLKKGLWSINEVCEVIIASNQYRIDTKTFNGLYYTVKAVRL